MKVNCDICNRHVRDCGKIERSTKRFALGMVMCKDCKLKERW